MNHKSLSICWALAAVVVLAWTAASVVAEENDEAAANFVRYFSSTVAKGNGRAHTIGVRSYCGGQIDTRSGDETRINVSLNK